MAAVILFTVLTVLIRNISPVSLQTSSHCRCLSGGFNNLDSRRLNERLLSVSEHAYISSSIYRSDFDMRLYWSRPSAPTLFRPSCTRDSSNMLVALLLLSSGNIERNPGPSRSPACKRTPTRAFNFGSLNIRSAVNKAPLLHNIIGYLNLDILTLQET